MSCAWNIGYWKKERQYIILVKLHELGFELLSHPPYSPDLAPSDYLLFADLTTMLQCKRFTSIAEITAERNDDFESKYK